MALSLSWLLRPRSRGSRSSADRPQTQASWVPRSQSAPQPHLTLPGHGARSAPSSGVAAPGFPKARARGAGLGPRSACGVRPVSGSGGTFPKLFVHPREGPRPCICHGGGLGASPCPGLRPCARPRFSPCSGPCVCPAVARGGGLAPGGGAGLGPALSVAHGAHEPPTYLPWPGSVSPPRATRGQQSTASFPGRCPSPGAGRDAHLCARALAARRARGRAPGGAAGKGRGWAREKREARAGLGLGGCDALLCAQSRGPPPLVVLWHILSVTPKGGWHREVSSDFLSPVGVRGRSVPICSLTHFSGPPATQPSSPPLSLSLFLPLLLSLQLYSGRLEDISSTAIVLDL